MDLEILSNPDYLLQVQIVQSLVIDDSDQPLTNECHVRKEAIVQTKAKMVVLDPIQGSGADVDIHRANEIRPLMKRIAVLSEKYHCAVI